MAGEQHVLTSFRGSYTLPDLSEESWQFNIRHAMVYGTVDDRGVLPDNLSVRQEPFESTPAGATYIHEWTYDRLSQPFDMEEWVTVGLRGAVEDFIAGTNWSNKVQLEEIRIYPITGPTGRSTDRLVNILTWDTPVKGTGTLDLLPLEVARVISWRTNRKGPKGRGRIYLPGATTQMLSSAGNIQPGHVNLLGPAAATMLSNMSYSGQGATPWNVRPIVTGAPYRDYAVIDHVRVGAVFDAQRRRRRSLPENYREDTVSY